MKLESHFYGIVDTSGGHEPAELARTMLDAGAKILQLRLKGVATARFVEAARAIASMCRDARALFIVNDRVDIAMLADADGVHLGQEDLPLEAGRRLLGAGKVIGVSTHSVEQARAAEAGGADYIGFGPVYPGGLKENREGKGLDTLRAVRAAVRIPIVAIGGITAERVPDVLVAGADAVAIITDIVRAPDVGARVREILAICARPTP